MTTRNLALLISAALMLAGCVDTNNPVQYDGERESHNEPEPERETPSAAVMSMGPHNGEWRGWNFASDPDMVWGEMGIRIDGQMLARSDAADCADPEPGTWTRCSNNQTPDLNRQVRPGDSFKVGGDSGDTVQVVFLPTGGVVRQMHM